MKGIVMISSYTAGCLQISLAQVFLKKIQFRTHLLDKSLQKLFINPDIFTMLLEADTFAS